MTDSPMTDSPLTDSPLVGPDRHYTDPRMAGLYDALDESDADRDFYLSLAGEAPLRVLEIGCGTGTLALAFSARGHAATGVDPAKAMLDIARAKPGAERVEWIEAEANGLALEQRFDLIVMTGHAFQVFVTDSEIAAVLKVARRHLAPGGRLAFETRNPQVREWESWTEEASRETVEVEGLGKAEVTWQVMETGAETVTFETRMAYEGEAEPLVSSSTLRFLEKDDLAARLAAAGFERSEWFGDWDASPFTETSREIIVVAS
jgi:ubiquinone/menaquinone biosynthesis C-methylase UbiE